jgi:putative nucleotidyltransferase with HDIG domain
VPHPLSLRSSNRPLPLLGAVAAGAAVVGWAAGALRERRRAARTHRTLVELLLNALSAGDAETERHSRRVADLTDSLAAALGMKRRERAMLRVAALLHDMGKINDRFFDIVHSRDPLSQEQRAEIEQHPYESAHILAPLEKLHPGILRAVASHHEWWNGNGYPDGREEHEIPLAARAIALADVFDALTQPRSYRDPLSVDEAIAKLDEDAGTKFDPQLVRLVESPRVRREWERIARRGLAAEREARAASVEERSEKSEE